MDLSKVAEVYQPFFNNNALSVCLFILCADELLSNVHICYDLPRARVPLASLLLYLPNPMEKKIWERKELLDRYIENKLYSDMGCSSL